MPDALPRISVAPAARPVYAARFSRREITSVRGEVSRHAAEAGLRGERLHDFVLAVNEIVTNAVVHGGGSGELKLWTIGQTVGCDVTDQGPQGPDGDGMPVAGASGQQVEHSEFDGERGGRGLMLARLLVDSLDMQATPHGTAVRLITVR